MSNGRDKFEGTDLQNEIHDARREAAAREQYIAWRMGDVPSVYLALMPYTCDVRELWEAERALRRQFVEDQKMAASPWRRVGPQPQLLDYGDMSASEKIAFAAEITFAQNFDGRIAKQGFEDHPAVRRAVATAQAEFESSGLKALWDERMTISDRLTGRSAEPVAADEVDALRARHTELVALIAAKERELELGE